MAPKSLCRIFFLILCLTGLHGTAGAQTAENHRLRVTPFQGGKDSLTLDLELRFWQVFREQVEKSETVQIVAGWDGIVELLEYAEESQRVAAIFDRSTIVTPAMKAPSHLLKGTLRTKAGGVAELDVQILKIETGEQTATEHGAIPLPTGPLRDQTTPALRRFVLRLLEPLDPVLRKLKAGFGEPFDTQKINILIADFTNPDDVVDAPGKLWAAKTSNELAQFMQADAALKQVVEVKRLSSKRTGIVILNEQEAESVGKALNADVIIWGQNLCIKDSICYYAKAFINHDARRVSTIEEGVLQEMQLLRADLPTLIGAKAQVLVKFIIGWTYLNDKRHTQFQQALTYLRQALAEAGRDERMGILVWAASAADDAGYYDTGLKWYAELQARQIEVGDRAGLAPTYNNMADVFRRKQNFDQAEEYGERGLQLCIQIGDLIKRKPGPLWPGAHAGGPAAPHRGRTPSAALRGNRPPAQSPRPANRLAVAHSNRTERLRRDRRAV